MITDLHSRRFFQSFVLLLTVLSCVVTSDANLLSQWDKRPGDINNDDRVGFLDYTTLSANWLADCLHPYWCTGADINTDGKVTINDLSIMADNWLGHTLEGKVLVAEDTGDGENEVSVTNTAIISPDADGGFGVCWQQSHIIYQLTS